MRIMQLTDTERKRPVRKGTGRREPTCAYASNRLQRITPSSAALRAVDMLMMQMLAWLRDHEG